MQSYDMAPRNIAPSKLERLAAASLRKPVIALMGEFSAGKSTLLNLLLGQNILPMQVTATRMPPVWLRYGNQQSFRLDKSGHRHPVDLNNLSGMPLKETRYVRIYCESEMLKDCDLMDTPGISDPNIPTDSWIRAIGYANAVLWCTHAGQAWRESERSAWESLPIRLRKTSLLLVTRADKIVSEIDRDKIDRRMQRENAHLFDGRHFISLTNAMAACEGEGDPALWTSSGAEAFMQSLERIIEGIGIERSYLLSRYVADPALESGTPIVREPVAAPEPAAPASEVPSSPFLRRVRPMSEHSVARPSAEEAAAAAAALKEAVPEAVVIGAPDLPVEEPVAVSYQEPEVETAPDRFTQSIAEPAPFDTTDSLDEPVAEPVIEYATRPTLEVPEDLPEAVESAEADVYAVLEEAVVAEATGGDWNAASLLREPEVELAPEPEAGRNLQGIFAPDAIEDVVQDDDWNAVPDEEIAGRDVLEATFGAVTEEVVEETYSDELSDVEEDVAIAMGAGATYQARVEQAPIASSQSMDHVVSLLEAAAGGAEEALSAAMHPMTPPVAEPPSRLAYAPPEVEEEAAYEPEVAGEPEAAEAMSEAETVREIWAEIQSTFDISRLPRLVAAMGQLMADLDAGERAAVALRQPAPAAPAAAETAPASGEPRKWVRGLF